MALTSELIVWSKSSVIGFKVVKIFFSTHCCNFLVINIFLSYSKNSVLSAFAVGEKILIPFTNFPTGSSPQ